MKTSLLTRLLSALGFRGFLATAVLFIIDIIFFFWLVTAWMHTSKEAYVQEIIQNLKGKVKTVEVMGEQNPTFFQSVPMIDSFFHKAFEDNYYRYSDESGKTILSKDTPDDLVFSIAEFEPIFFSLPESDQTIVAIYGVLPNGHRLLVGKDVSMRLSSLYKFRWFIWVCMIVLVVCSITALLQCISMVRNINFMSDGINNILYTGDLNRSVAAPSSLLGSDGIIELGHQLNALFELLKNTIRESEQIGDSIAHDLRTPLTHIRTRIEELICDEPQSHASRQKVYAAIADSIDNLLYTFRSLLNIAALQRDKYRKNFTQVNMQELVCDIYEYYHPMAQMKQCTIKMNVVPASIFGDKHLLFQLFTNLMDNAIKFAPKKTTITVTLSKSDDGLQVSICDSGPGIPLQLREKVFERFYRVDTSRHTAGNGLGLTLVSAIVRQHGGKIHLADNAPGLVVTIDFPKNSA